MSLHEFKPNRYYRTFGTHPPALTLLDGESVRTTTIDAAGVDAAGTAVAPAGNPLTGPFRIEGATAGDTLSVKILAIRPTRTWAYSSSSLASVVVDPEYVHQLPTTQGPGRIYWDVDLSELTAKPSQPLTGCEDLELALSPMLGCIGVAPEGAQSISSATSGPHGGNMDYRQIREGTTLQLPVFESGALLFLGDCHALQGAGELSGTGLEVPCEVQVEVRLSRGRRIAWPRGETKDTIFAIGNARPLDQATRHATTEMLRWLTEDYGLDFTAASVLIGQCADLDLANMFNPAFSVAIKLAKSVLPGKRTDG